MSMKGVWMKLTMNNRICKGAGVARPRGWRAVHWLALLALVPGLAMAQTVDLVLNHDVVGPTTINASETARFEVVVDNTNPSHTGTANNVQLSYQISGSDTLLSATPSQGSCGAPDGNNLFTCALGTIEWSSDGSSNVTVDIEIRATGTGITNFPYTLSANALVSTSSNDIDLTNNEQERVVTVQAGTDLAITLDSSPVVVASGGLWTHTITLNNLGPINATNIVVHFDLPAGVQLSGSLPGGCVTGGPGLICSLSALALGSAHDFGPIVTQVAVAGGSNLSATAFIESLDQFDGNADNDSSTRQVAVSSGSDLSVSLGHTGGTLLENQPFDLLVTTQYTGEVPDAPTLQITIDPGLSLVNSDPFTQNGWACTVTGQVVNCTYPNTGGLSVGASQPLGALNLTVVGAEAGTYANNQAQIASDTSNKPDPNLDNNSDSTSVVIQGAELDIRLNKIAPTRDLRTIGVDYPFSFEVRLRNQGNIAFWGQLAWTDNVPLGLTVTSIDPPVGWNCNIGPVSGVGTIGCFRNYPESAPLAPNATVTFTVNAYANGAVEGPVVNQACLTTVDHDLGFLVNEGNQDCDTAGIDAQLLSNSADLRVRKTATPDPVTAGEALTYTLEIINDGPATAESVTLTDSLGNLFTGSGGNSFQGAVVTNNSATGGSCGGSGNPGNPGSRTLNCSFAEIPVCDQGVNCPLIEVTILPHGAANSGVVFTRPNAASAFSSVTADPNYGNNQGTVDVQVNAQTDLQIEKTVTTWSGELGTALNYRIEVRNIGASGASNLVLTDTLPHDVTYLSVNPGGSASCATQPAAGSTTAPGNDQVVCTRNTLARGATWTIDLQTRPNHGIVAGTELVNLAVVSTDTPETSIANNSDTAAAIVSQAVVDLATVKTDTPDPVFVGDEVTYTVRVTNNGPSVAEEATLYDFLPSAGFRFVAGSVSFYDVVGGALVPIDPLDLPGLGIECSRLPADQAIGTGFPANALGYLWPADVTINPAYLNGIWNPAAGDLEGEADVICNLGFLEPAQTRAIRYRMIADERGVYFHHAVSRSREHRENGADGPDPVPGNDVTRERTTVRSVPDVSVTKQVSTDPVALLEPFHYLITFTNNSATVPADHPELHDQLPAGMELLAAPVILSGAPDGAVCSGEAGDTSFVCDLAAGLPPLGEVVIEVPVRVVSGGAAILNNRVDVFLDTDLEFDVDPDPVVSDDEDVRVVVSSIAGRVYHDQDLSGTLTPGNPPIADVIITLEGSTPWGDEISGGTMTASDGSYRFDDLPPGLYQLTQTQPDGWIDGPDNVGTIDGVVVGINPVSKVLSEIELPADREGIEYNFGEYLDSDDLQPALVLEKTASTAGPVAMGDEIEYTLTATNTGNVALSNVVIVDEMIELVCTPALPATLAAEESLVCTGVYEVVPADLGREILNVAIVTADAPGGEQLDDESSVGVPALDPLPVPLTGPLGLALMSLLLLLTGLFARSLGGSRRRRA